MAIDKVTSASIATDAVGPTQLNEASNYDFTGTVTGATSTQNHFRALKTSNQNPTNNVYTKVTFNTEEYDTSSTYDHSNNKFVPANGSVWLLTGQLNISGEPHGLQAARCRLTKNGSNIHTVYCDTYDVDSNIMSPILSHIITGNGSDYYELYVQIYCPSTTPELQSNSYFQGVQIFT